MAAGRVRRRRSEGRMGSALTTVLLPLALALVMFGLGLSLTVGDFARVGRQPKAVVIALVLQLLVLPAVCFGLVLAFDLPPLLAVGLMLLAASPGWHDGQPVQPPVPRRRRAQHHADGGQLAHRRRHPAAHHQPGDRLLRPRGRRQPRAAARQDAAGLRRRPGAGRHRDGRPAAGDRVRRPHGQAGADRRRRWSSRWSSSARSSPSGRTSPATSPRSACRRCCSAWPA